MACEPKEWIKTTHRSGKNKSGGIFVYIDSQTLEFSGLPTDKPLVAKRYPSKNNTVIIKLKVKE